MLIKTRQNLRALALAALCACSLGLSGCQAAPPVPSDPPAVQSASGGPADAVRFDRTLDGYDPGKKEYDFYFTSSPAGRSGAPPAWRTPPGSTRSWA